MIDRIDQIVVHEDMEESAFGRLLAIEGTPILQRMCTLYAGALNPIYGQRILMLLAEYPLMRDDGFTESAQENGLLIVLSTMAYHHLKKDGRRLFADVLRALVGVQSSTEEGQFARNRGLDLAFGRIRSHRVVEVLLSGTPKAQWVTPKLVTDEVFLQFDRIQAEVAEARARYADPDLELSDNESDDGADAKQLAPHEYEDHMANVDEVLDAHNPHRIINLDDVAMAEADALHSSHVPVPIDQDAELVTEFRELDTSHVDLCMSIHSSRSAGLDVSHIELERVRVWQMSTEITELPTGLIAQFWNAAITGQHMVCKTIVSHVHEAHAHLVYQLYHHDMDLMPLLCQMASTPAYDDLDGWVKTIEYIVSLAMHPKFAVPITILDHDQPSDAYLTCKPGDAILHDQSVRYRASAPEYVWEPVDHSWRIGPFGWLAERKKRAFPASYMIAVAEIFKTAGFSMTIREPPTHVNEQCSARTPMHVAASNGHAHLVEWFLRQDTVNRHYDVRDHDGMGVIDLLLDGFHMRIGAAKEDRMYGGGSEATTLPPNLSEFTPMHSSLHHAFLMAKIDNDDTRYQFHPAWSKHRCLRQRDESKGKCVDCPFVRETNVQVVYTWPLLARSGRTEWTPLHGWMYASGVAKIRRTEQSDPEEEEVNHTEEPGQSRHTFSHSPSRIRCRHSVRS
jgi:hypothetical protein